MSARDDYWLLKSQPFPLVRAALDALNGGPSALDEIDRLRAENARGGEVCQYVKGYDGSRFCGLNMPDNWEAIRQTVNCPTCDGEQFVFAADGALPGSHCPDCTDGKIDIARALHIVANVFDGSPVANPYGDSARADAFDHGVDATFAQLRAVRP